MPTESLCEGLLTGSVRGHLIRVLFIFRDLLTKMNKALCGPDLGFSFLFYFRLRPESSPAHCAANVSLLPRAARDRDFGAFETRYGFYLGGFPPHGDMNKNT